MKRRYFVVGNVGQTYLYTYRMTEVISHMYCLIPHSDQKTGQMPGMIILDQLSGLVSFELCHPVRVKVEEPVKAGGSAQTQRQLLKFVRVCGNGDNEALPSS